MKKFIYLTLAIQIIGATFGGFIGVYYGGAMAAFMPPDVERIMSCVAEARALNG